jgi:UMF1 family MFS transporter
LILVCIVAYFGVTVFALQLDTAFEFWFLASFVGVFQGAIQALSRSYYAKMIPEKKSSEYFGVYDIFGKGAAFVGTMLMGATTQIFGTSKAGVGSISLLFIAGFIVFLLQNKAVREQ